MYGLNEDTIWHLYRWICMQLVQCDISYSMDQVLTCAQLISVAVHVMLVSWVSMCLRACFLSVNACGSGYTLLLDDIH